MAPETATEDGLAAPPVVLPRRPWHVPKFFWMDVASTENGEKPAPPDAGYNMMS